MHHHNIYSVVPTPNVTIAVLNDQIISTPLSLRCDVTTVMGISSSVDIVWMKDDTEILRENDTIGDPISNATVMYTSHYYNVTTLRITDDNITYYCQAIINTSPMVNNSGSYTLNVIGEYVYIYVYRKTFKVETI